MNNLMMFENKQVEVFEWKGKVLFNPKHVGECLGIKNVNDNISRMNSKQVIKLTNSNIGISDFRKLHNTGENFLTESGVYKLIFKSHKSEAEKFQDWVTDEVLPLIRKNGSYQLPKMSKELQAILLLDNRTEKIEADVQQLKNDLPLFNVECKELQASVRKLGIKHMGGKESNAYKDNSLRGRIYSDIQTEIKRQFQVTKYEAIKRHQLPMAYKILENYKLPIVLKNAVDIANNQTAFNEVACTKTEE